MRDKGIQEYERIEWMVDHLGYGSAARSEYQEKFGLSQQKYYADRKQALELMKEKLQADAEQWKSDLISRLEKLYERNINNPRNQGVALEVLKTLAKLTGNDEQKVIVEASVPKIRWDLEDDGDTGSE